MGYLKLSICIPTYNRMLFLKKLLVELQRIQRMDVEFVVLNDQSDDGTAEMLEQIKDKRLRVILNRKKVHAHNTMINAIWSGKGEYILFCNDRDFLYADKTEELLEILDKGEYSYLHLSKKNLSGNHGSIQVFQPGFDSVIHHDVTHHPTGTVYNGRIIREQINNREKYLCYKDNCYAWDLLMMDMVWHAPSAECDLGIYDVPGDDFFLENSSGAKITKRSYYADPVFQRKIMCRFCSRLEKTYKLRFSDRELQEVYSHMIDFFARQMYGYKQARMYRPYIQYYGLEMKWLSTSEVLGIYRKFCRTVHCLEQKYGFLFGRQMYLRHLIMIILHSIYADFKFILKKESGKERVRTHTAK